MGLEPFDTLDVLVQMSLALPTELFILKLSGDKSPAYSWVIAEILSNLKVVVGTYERNLYHTYYLLGNRTSILIHPCIRKRVSNQLRYLTKGLTVLK